MEQFRTIPLTQQILTFRTFKWLWWSSFTWQTWQVSQTKHLPASRPDWERSVEAAWWIEDGARTGLLHVCALFQLDILQQSRPLPSLGGTERWLKVWNSSHNWAEWAFVSWLITADSWLSFPPSHPPRFLFPPSPLCLLCLAVHQWKRYY